MQWEYFFNLIFIFASNILFFFSGICLNSLVILTFWRSVQLRKKLCYFMIMILSCCDLLVVLTNHPLTALTAMLWLTGRLNKRIEALYTSINVANIFIGFSLHALIVTNFDGYLATYYPFLHRTSVTKAKLLALFTMLNFIVVTLGLLSVYDFISVAVFILIVFIMVVPPMLFINYKLFTIASSRRNNGKSFRMAKTFSLKNISSCLLIVACFVVLTIPTFVYIGLRMMSKDDTFNLDGANLAALWAKTISSMNSTCNCLIVYWKNKILRAEAMKIIKGVKMCRRVARLEGRKSH